MLVLFCVSCTLNLKSTFLFAILQEFKPCIKNDDLMIKKIVFKLFFLFFKEKCTCTYWKVEILTCH